MNVTRASNGLVKLSLFVQKAAQKAPDQLTAVAGVIHYLEVSLGIFVRSIITCVIYSMGMQISFTIW